VTTLLREWIRHTLLAEGRLQDVLNKVPERMEHHVRTRASKDPSGNLKYLGWQADQLHTMMSGAGSPPSPWHVEEYIKDLIRVVELFHKSVKRLPADQRDINVHDDYSDLLHDLENMPPSKSDLRRKAKAEGRKVYSDDRFVIIQPRTKEAAQYYGKGTKWCISAMEDNAFDDYDLDGVQFYFVFDRRPNSEPMSKVAFAVGEMVEGGVAQIFDARDNDVAPFELVEDWGADVTRKIVSVIDADEIYVDVSKRFEYAYFLAGQGSTSPEDFARKASESEIQMAVIEHPETFQSEMVQAILLDRGFIVLLLNEIKPLTPLAWSKISVLIEEMWDKFDDYDVGSRLRRTLDVLAQRDDVPLDTLVEAWEITLNVVKSEDRAKFGQSSAVWTLMHLIWNSRLPSDYAYQAYNEVDDETRPHVASAIGAARKPNLFTARRILDDPDTRELTKTALLSSIGKRIRTPREGDQKWSNYSLKLVKDRCDRFVQNEKLGLKMRQMAQRVSDLIAGEMESRRQSW